MNRGRLLEIYQRYKEKRVKEIIKTVKEEKEYSFESKSGDTYSYDVALSMNFISEDGKPLLEINNYEFLSNLDEEMHKLNSEIEELKILRSDYKAATEIIEE